MQKAVLYKLAYDFWGQDAQLDMCVEECSELIQSICKYKRNEGNDINRLNALIHMASEIADVEIMLEQLKLMMGVEGQVDIEKSYKLSRLEERLRD